MVNQDHRRPRSGDGCKRRQLAEPFRVADARARTIREHLKERDIERPADSLRDLLPETIRTARVTARHAGDCINGGLAPELADKCHQQLGGVINQPGVEFSLRPFQRCMSSALAPARQAHAAIHPISFLRKTIGRYTSEPSSPALCRGRSVSVAPARNVASPNSTKPASCGEAQKGSPQAPMASRGL